MGTTTTVNGETKYVAGFLFSDERDAVALIHKTHGPGCMIGKWNAIGGKIRKGEPGLPDESSSAAMWREFMEEAGADVSWTLFLKLQGPGWSVDFYHAFSTSALSQVRTCEGEVVSVFRLNALPETVPNLRWIIPMALGHEDDHVWVYEVTEKETFAPRAATPIPHQQNYLKPTEEMVSRFLQWTLPNDFRPDGGISFKPSQFPMPVGTNLLDYGQAKAMLEFVLATTPVAVLTADSNVSEPQPNPKKGSHE